MTWLWLLICWGCLLAGFVLGGWWATGRERGREAEDAIYIQELQHRIVDFEDEVAELRQARKAEWERKIDAGGAS